MNNIKNQLIGINIEQVFDFLLSVFICQNSLILWAILTFSLLTNTYISIANFLYLTYIMINSYAIRFSISVFTPSNKIYHVLYK
ncbi:hypothetical protein BN168_130049 [Clostridioides difficile CD002]|nr:hypothetical protein BN168_130049 [Clostridioides difficile CD002]